MTISYQKLCANFDSFGCLIGKRLPALNLKMAVKIGNGAFLFLLVLILSIVKKRNEKSYQVQAFCEERDSTPLLGVIW